MNFDRLLGALGGVASHTRAVMAVAGLRDQLRRLVAPCRVYALESMVESVLLRMDGAETKHWELHPAGVLQYFRSEAEHLRDNCGAAQLVV
jgi:hypothetical protein